MTCFIFHADVFDRTAEGQDPGQIDRRSRWWVTPSAFARASAGWLTRLTCCQLTYTVRALSSINCPVVTMRTERLVMRSPHTQW